MDSFPSKLFILEQCFSPEGIQWADAKYAAYNRTPASTPSKELSVVPRLRNPALENISHPRGLAITKIFRKMFFQNYLVWIYSLVSSLHLLWGIFYFRLILMTHRDNLVHSWNSTKHAGRYLHTLEYAHKIH